MGAFLGSERDNRRWLCFFSLGFLAGLILLLSKQWFWIEQTGLYDGLTLTAMRGIRVRGWDFFWYSLCCRLGSLLLLTVLFYTVFGMVAAYLWLLWLGFAAGMGLCALCIRLGFGGILLFLAGIVPQIFFFLPGTLAFLSWGKGLWNRLYKRGGMQQSGGAYWGKKGMQLFGILLVICLGCVAESCISTEILNFMLEKVFY